MTHIDILLDLLVVQWCAEWEIKAFNLTVLGVKSFVVKIGDASSRVVEVCLCYWFDIVKRPYLEFILVMGILQLSSVKELNKKKIISSLFFVGFSSEYPTQ